MALKTHFPGVADSVGTTGWKVTPDELDMDYQYIIQNPGVGTASLGTAAAGTVNVAWTRIATYCDYPRSVCFSVLGPAGGAGGTCVINGKSQFGGTITETITIASANGGGTANGSQVFAEFTSGTYYPNGGDNTSTPFLGYAIGTMSTGTPVFGLPAKLGGTSDIKQITWIDNGTTKAPTNDAAAAADTGQHGVQIEVTGGVAAADAYVVTYRPTYDASGDQQMFAR